MIDYIKYTVDGLSFYLIDNGDGTWSKEAAAPSVVGNYGLLIEISENGSISYIDASNSKYDFYLDMIVSAERIIFLQDYLPDFLKEIHEINDIADTHNLELDKLFAEIRKVNSNMFIETSSRDAITRLENFFRIKGQGTLGQRKSYLMSLLQKGKKLNEVSIRNIANSITGSDCIITFYTANQMENPDPGYSLLMIQVLSPDSNKDYRYEDITRTLRPLVPSHVKLNVVKYFSQWNDIKMNFEGWNAIAAMTNWTELSSYVP